MSSWKQGEDACFKKTEWKPIKFLLQLDIEPKSRACVSHDHIFIVIVVLET